MEDAERWQSAIEAMRRTTGAGELDLYIEHPVLDLAANWSELTNKPALPSNLHVP